MLTHRQIPGGKPRRVRWRTDRPRGVGQELYGMARNGYRLALPQIRFHVQSDNLIL